MKNENETTTLDTAPLLTKIIVWLIGMFVFALVWIVGYSVISAWAKAEKKDTKRRMKQFHISRWMMVR
jgi:hypothetical protein